MIKLTDLSPLKVRMLTRMAGPFDQKDATGVQASRLSEDDRRAALELASIGLAMSVTGWDSTQWFMLTDKGWKVRETGEA